MRALNRATLARQLLLERAAVSPIHAVHHLVGLQAQIPNNPYIGLWSRLAGFDPMSVSDLVRDRALVRLTVMRGTLHLVTADDCLLLRPLMQPVLDDERRHHRDFAPLLEGVDLEPVIAFGREVLSERALSGTELRAAMHERFPDLDAGALAFACRSGLAIGPGAAARRMGALLTGPADDGRGVPGRPVETQPSIDDVVLRYLGAFGPATTSDISAWCRLRGMAEVVERLRPRLRVFRNERGRELFDLPDAPRPDLGVPAPIRFLPEYDNLWLAHDDRSRVLSEDEGAADGVRFRPVPRLGVDRRLASSRVAPRSAAQGAAGADRSPHPPTDETSDRIRERRGSAPRADDPPRLVDRGQGLGSVNRGTPSRPTSATLYPRAPPATRSGIRAYPIQGVRPLGAESLPWSCRPPRT